MLDLLVVVRRMCPEMSTTLIAVNADLLWSESLAHEVGSRHVHMQHNCSSDSVRTK